MKRKKLKISIVIIGILLFVALYSFFRSIVDSTSYLIALDHVLSIIMSEAWDFISNPTIFVTFVIVILLWLTRDKILSLFPAIREIKAGSFSALIDYSQVNEIVKLEESTNVKPVENEISNTDSDVIENYLVSLFAKDTLNFVLSMDNQFFTGPSLFKKVQEDKLGSTHIVDFNNLEETTSTGYYLGVYILFRRLFFPRFFTTDEDLTINSTKFNLRPKIKKAIEVRLEKLTSKENTSL